MAIEDLGESLLATQRTNREERDKAARRRRKDQKIEGYLQMGGKLLVSIAQTNSERKALQFMQQEPIMAARAKYNAGVQQSITHLDNNKKAQAHAQGVEGYLRDQYIPLLEKQLKMNVDEQSYTKDGFDQYVYTQATELAKKNKTLFNEATQAAMSVGNDSTAFEKFIKINDGIADTPLGSVAQGVAGFFRGKSGGALRADAANSIINSRYIRDVDALAAAQSALARGVPVQDAQKIAKSMESFKASDNDYEVVSEKADTQTVYINGKQNTVTGRRVLKKDGWGREKETFVPDETSTDLKTQTTPKVTTTQVTIGGIVYNRKTEVQLDPYDNPVSDPIVTDTPVRLDPLRAASVTPAEAEATAQDFRHQLGVFQSGHDSDFNGFSDAYAEYVLRDINVDNEDLAAKTFTAAYADMVADSSVIKFNTKTDGYKNNSATLSQTISQHIVLNDMARMVDKSVAPDFFEADDFDFSLSVKKAEPTTLEILEALGSIKKSNAARVDSAYIAGVVKSEALMEELNNLQSDKKTLTAYLQSFNGYQDDPAYNHLFKPLISDKSGNSYSVYQLLQSIQD